MTNSGSDNSMELTDDQQNGTTNNGTSCSQPTDNGAATSSTSAHSVDMEVEAVSSPTPAHSVGQEQAAAKTPHRDSELSESDSSSDSESSTDSSASSPSGTEAPQRYDGSASSPSDSEEPRPSTIKRTHSVPPQPNFAQGRNAAPRLMPCTNVRTIDELKAKVLRYYHSYFDEWDSGAKGRAEPPIAFTENWFNHKFCQPFVEWYRKYVPIVKAREDEDRAKRQAEEEDVLGPSADDEPAAEEVISEELAAKLPEEPSPAVKVPSVKPAEPFRIPKVTPTHSVGRSSSAGAAPAHSVGPTASSVKKSDHQRKTVADIKRRGQATAPTTSSRSSTGSKRSRDDSSASRHPPKKDARQVGQRSASSPPTPNRARHMKRVKETTLQCLTPVLDGYVSKELAVHVGFHGHRQHQWVQLFLEPQKKYELLGLISHFGVPASYLQIEHCKSTGAGDHTPLANITYHQLLLEDKIIPWDFILTSTVGAFPPYWRQCRRSTRRHLTDALEDSKKYRDFGIGGIGPVGFDLRGVPVTNTNEYEQQRLTLIEFARIARDTKKGLVVMIFFDENSPYTNCVHLDAIQSLQREGIPPSQPIHLIYNKVTALELIKWLEAFPRTLIGFDFRFVSDIRVYLAQKDLNPAHEDYLYACAFRDLLECVPLENIALHSGCPLPKEPEDLKVHYTPHDVLNVATEIQLMTGTKSEVIHTNNAYNLIKFYRLDHRLLDHCGTRRDYHHQRCSLDELVDKIYDLFGGRPRAAQAEQGRDEEASISRRSRSPLHSSPPRREDRSRRSYSSSKRRSPSQHSTKTDRKSRRDRFSPTHSVGKKSSAARDSSRNPRQSPARSSSSSIRCYSPSHPEPITFKINLDVDKRDKQDLPPTRKEEVMPYDDEERVQEHLRQLGVLKKGPSRPSSRLDGRVSRDGEILRVEAGPSTTMERVCNFDIPLRDIATLRDAPPSTSRLGGRISQGGNIPPPESEVRTKIKSLREAFGDVPQPTPLQQLKALRQQQAQPPAHSVGVAAQASAPAHSAGKVDTYIRCPDMRLLQIPPTFETDMFPVVPTPNEVYSETLKFLRGEPDATSGLRHGNIASLATQPIEPAQPELFEVPSPNGELCPMDPFFECQGDQEDPEFHRTCIAFSLVTDGFWRNKKGMKTPAHQALLKEVQQLKVRTLMQMVYLKYGTRLRSNHADRTPNALRFIREVLLAANPRQDLPRILQRLHPTFTNDKTRDAWPAPIDFQRAVEHWSCYCVHAGIYVKNHLSGPVIFRPDWFLEPFFPQDVRQTFRVDIANDEFSILHDLRRRVYHQYNLEHIKAIEEKRREFVWRRFDDDEDRLVQLGLEITQPTIVFVDQTTWDSYHRGLRTVMICVNTTSPDAVWHDIRQYFPRPIAERVVFWFGFDFLHAGNCYGSALATLCYHFAQNLGHVEQYAIMPPYIRSRRLQWTDSVLVTFIQRQEILPYARVVVQTLDLRAWERDERELQVNGQLRVWESTRMDEDGYYHTNDLIEATKENLRLHHDLNLWRLPGEPEESPCSTDNTSACQTSSCSEQQATSSAKGTGSTSLPSTIQKPSGSGTHSVPTYQMPSGSGAHSVPTLDPNLIAAALAAQFLNRGAPGEVDPSAAVGAAAFITERAFALAARDSAREVSPRFDDLDKRLSQPRRQRERSDHSKNRRSRSRKDQDRGSRK